MPIIIMIIIMTGTARPPALAGARPRSRHLEGRGQQPALGEPELGIRATAARFLNIKSLKFLPDPGALNSCMHTFPEKEIWI